MFKWFTNLFRKEEPKKQEQVVESGRIAIQADGNIVVSTPGRIELSAKTVEVKAPQVPRPPQRTVSSSQTASRAARKPTQTASRPAPSTSRSSSSSRRRDDDSYTSDLLNPLNPISPVYVGNNDYSSPSSSSDSCSSSRSDSYSSSSSYDSGSSSSYDSGSSSSDSGSCGGGGD